MGSFMHVPQNMWSSRYAILDVLICLKAASNALLSLADTKPGIMLPFYACQSITFAEHKSKNDFNNNIDLSIRHHVSVGEADIFSVIALWSSI